MSNPIRAYFIMTEWAAGQKIFDIENLMTSPTGLTGSEVSFFRMARGLSQRGHEVAVYAPIRASVRLEGISYHPIGSLEWASNLPRYAYAWNDPTPLFSAPPGVTRICNQQLNDFSYLPDRFDDSIDIWTSPSRTHLSCVGSLAPNPEKWEIVNNGCDIHPIEEKVPGRVIWSSSFDRGLHWLLSIWPEVKKEVPHAELLVFYSMRKWLDIWGSYDPNSPDVMDSRQYRRATFINQSLKKLQNHGVTLRDQVSRYQMEREYAHAEILAYPCDTVSFTEGFSVSILDACSFGCVPIISNTDALGELYGDHVPTIPSPMSANITFFKQRLIELLLDTGTRKELSIRAWKRSHELTWENSIQQFLNVLQKRGIE